MHISMADQPQGVATADNHFLEAVLVKLGDGNWLTFEHNGLLSLSLGTLLMVLKHDEAFTVTLRDVSLEECAVNVCVSLS